MQRKARTPHERPGGERRGILHFAYIGKTSFSSRESSTVSLLFLPMNSSTPIQARQTPMGNEIPIKPLSLWPEYSTSGLLILFKKP